MIHSTGESWNGWALTETNAPRQHERLALPQQSDVQIKDFIVEIERVLMSNRYLFLWTDKYSLTSGDISNKWLSTVTTIDVRDLIVWDKEWMGLGYRARRCSEFLTVIQKEPYKAKASWKDGKILDVWREKLDRKPHPHTKPVDLQSRLIAATTEPGDLIVDPCAGSYSVLRACRKVGGRDFPWVRFDYT